MRSFQIGPHVMVDVGSKPPPSSFLLLVVRPGATFVAWDCFVWRQFFSSWNIIEKTRGFSRQYPLRVFLHLIFSQTNRWSAWGSLGPMHFRGLSVRSARSVRSWWGLVQIQGFLTRRPRPPVKMATRSERRFFWAAEACLSNQAVD